MNNDNRLTTALLLAAGTGSRLRPLTLHSPKCLTEVAGKTILGRLIDNLRSQGIKRLVVVTGYLDHCIREFLNKNAFDMQVDYVFNPVYQTTNNIYSLWLARQIIQEPFLLVESDLVFEESSLRDLLIPNKIAISRIMPWMAGTTVELDDEQGVTAFHSGKEVCNARQYKTVNICSLSLTSWKNTIDRLDQYIADNRVSEYYEVVFSEMISDGSLDFDAVFFAEDSWYEVDSVNDLIGAERILASLPELSVIPVIPAIPAIPAISAIPGIPGIPAPQTPLVGALVE